MNFADAMAAKAGDASRSLLLAMPPPAGRYTAEGLTWKFSPRAWRPHQGRLARIIPETVRRLARLEGPAGAAMIGAESRRPATRTQERAPVDPDGRQEAKSFDFSRH